MSEARFRAAIGAAAKFEEGRAYATIALFDLREIADECGMGWREAEVEALRFGVCPVRYARNLGTVGIEGQIKLLESRAAVVGLGGLGGLTSELLARAGVGHLILIDGDDFAESNLNRQLLCTEQELGQGKAAAAMARISAVNDAVVVETIGQYIASDEDAETFLASADLAVDALDGNDARRIVSRFCRRARIPLVHGAIGGLWAQAAIFGPDDPNTKAPWDADENLPDKGEEQDTGNPSFTAAFCASLQTAMAVQIITGVGSIRTGVLHWFDLGEGTMQRLVL